MFQVCMNLYAFINVHIQALHAHTNEDSLSKNLKVAIIAIMSLLWFINIEVAADYLTCTIYGRSGISSGNFLPSIRRNLCSPGFQ